MKIHRLLFLLLFSVFSATSFATNLKPSAVADQFYSAFAAHDSSTMVSLYAESSETVFSDPIFQQLNSAEAKGMWNMLVEAAPDLKLSYQLISATDTQVIVNWQATYTYSTTGQKILNEVQSRLEIVDGRIVKQEDSFDLCRWTKQAFGPENGALACLHPETLRAQARAQLDMYLKAHSGKQ